MSINDIVDKIKRNPQVLKDIVFWDILCKPGIDKSEKASFYKNVIYQVERTISKEVALNLAIEIIEYTAGNEKN